MNCDLRKFREIFYYKTKKQNKENNKKPQKAKPNFLYLSVY